MKLKEFLFLMLIVLTLLLAAGCNSKTEDAKESDTTEAVAETEPATIPEGRPQLVGKIKEVIGNEVTIYKAEINEVTETQNQNEPSQNKADQSNKKRMAFDFTEETETIIIPVGTQIAGAGRNTAELMEISDLKAEQTIMVWQQDENITFVQVRGGKKTTTPNNGQGQVNTQGPAGVPGGQIVIRGGNRQP